MNLHIAAEIEYGFDGGPKEILLVKDEVEFRLTKEEWLELLATIAGEREILHREIKEGTFYPKSSFVFNKIKS